MLKAQKKISKKEIKEDKLVTTYFEARTWMERNTRLVTIIVLVPVALIVLLVAWNWKRSQANEAATTRLAKIMPYYDDGRYDLAINGVPQEGTHGLQSIVDEYGSTKAGGVASLYLANAYYASGQYDRALQAYKGVDVSDRMLTASAYAGIGACYEAKHAPADAAPWFEKAAAKDMELTMAPDNLQRAAANYAAAGDKPKAVELLKTLKKEFPTSPNAREADRYIAEFAS